MSFFEIAYPQKADLTLEEQRKRWMPKFLQAFSVVFMVYFASYMVRQNMNPANAVMGKKLGMSPVDIANMLSLHTIAYGVGKLVLGFVADRKNTKKFVSFLLIIGGLCNFIIGILFFSKMDLKTVTLGTAILWGINGFVLSPGGPCAYSTIMRWQPRSKQATWLGRWNVSHNVGGALAAIFASFVATKFFGGNIGGFFILPGLLAIGIGVWGMFFGYDDPAELGWDEAEKVLGEVDKEAEIKEKEEALGEELSKWQVFLKDVLTNPWVFIVCFSNVFVYIIRMGMVKWVIYYATSIKLENNVTKLSALLTVIELTAIIGSLFFGWLSDKLKGRRMVISGVIMLLLFVGAIIYQNAKTYSALAIAMCFCGFLIFGPQLLVGISVVKFAPKKAIAVANGLSGTFGYLLGDLLALQLIGRLVGDPKKGTMDWGKMFIILMVSAIIGAILMFIAAVGEERNIRMERKLDGAKK